jgi:hypothetical protein
MNKTRNLLYALGLAGLASIPTQAASVETQGFLKYECWFPPLRDSTATGTAVSVLTSDPNYPATPDMTSYVAGWNSRFVFPDDSHEQYGDRITGWITPTVTGDYNFFIRSDDASELWISTDSTEANLALVAAETGCCNPFLEPGAAQTTATPLHLVAGQKYYIQSLHKEGGGGDYVQVAWRLSTDTTPAASLSPIGGMVLSSMADNTGASVTINQQPQAISTPENTAATFTIDATGVTPYKQYTSGGTPAQGGAVPLGTTNNLAPFYQWFTNGVPVAGANGTNYTILWPKKAADGGKKVKCYVAVPGVPTYSSEVTLTVTDDTTPPTIANVTSDMTFTHVLVKFSEPVSDTALTASNYTMDGGITVSSVSRIDLLTVQLTTSKLTDSTTYNLTVNNVQDTATPANTIAANSKFTFRSFVFMQGAILHKYWDNISGGGTNDLFNDSRYPNNPTFTTVEPMFEYPPNGGNGVADNYDNTLETYFVPPVNGNYVFFTCSDDYSWLYLSTDDNPANKHLIAEETGWSNSRQWVAVGSGDATAKRSDQFANIDWPTYNTITLQANKRYYLLDVHHEGGGGDNVEATYKMDTDPDPNNGDAPKLTGSVVGFFFDPNGASLTWVSQPQNVSAVQNTSAVLSGLATGTSAYGTNVTYQWQAMPSGGTVWTNVSGASAASYTTPLLPLSYNGTKYQLIAMVPTLSQTSQVATLTVTADTTAPKIVSSGVLKGSSYVGLVFDKFLDQASAETTGNYTVSGATVTAANLHKVLGPGGTNGWVVTLTVANPLNSAPTVTVNGVKDLAGNAISSTTVTPVLDSTMTSMDVGTAGSDPLQAGYAVCIGTNAYLVAGGGHDIWDNADGFQFLYKSFTGPFDLRMRVQGMNPRWVNPDGSGTGNDGTWAKTELMVRETTDAGSRHNSLCVTRADGENAVEEQWRDVSNQGCGNNRVLQGEPFPNMWVRLVRPDATTGAITIYTSTNGVNWDLTTPATHTTPVADQINDMVNFPSTVLVGIGVTRHNNITDGYLAEGIVDNFSVQTYVPYVDPQLKVATDSTGKVTISWAAGTLVASPTVKGTYTPVTGATSPYVVTPTAGTTMFYQVKQ